MKTSKKYGSPRNKLSLLLPTFVLLLKTLRIYSTVKSLLTKKALNVLNGKKARRKLAFIWRMRKLYAAALFIFATLFSLHSQAQVTGLVADTAAAPVPFCNVILINASDSSIVTATTTNESGGFSLEKKDSGTFRIRVKFVGYKEFYSEVFLLSDAQPQHNAGTITLQQDATVLADAVITADKPFMEQQLDRTVYNIQNSIISSGNNALEVLRKLPGVTVDNNDNIQVRGKAGVQIMIDGRMSQLSGQDIAAYLRTIDASQIEKIEVIMNPSAKYDAAGYAVINIVLVRDRQKGFNGQVSGNYQQGFYHGKGGSANGNYRLEKFNFFGSYGQGDGYSYDESRRITDFTGGAESFDNRQRFKNHFGWNYARAGVDFFPNGKHTIGIVAEGHNGDNRQERTFSTLMYRGGVVDSSTHTSTQQRNISRWRSYNLNYLYRMDTTGRELSANFSYAPFSIVSTRSNDTWYYDSAGAYIRPPGTQKMRFPTVIDIAAGQLDYIQPFGAARKLEAGLKGSYVSTDNDGNYWNVINGAEVNDTTMSNHFVYTETIFAGYANFMQEVNKKLSYQVGLRGEQTQARGEQLTTGESFDRKYFNLFPSTFINWKIDSTHTLNLSYSRRIDRPDYGDLNPFRFYNNPYTYFTGNPYLRPQISHNVELTHVYKEVFSVTAGYLHMKDVFAFVPRAIDSTRTVYSRVENFNTYVCFNISGALTMPLTNWLTTITTVNVFHDNYSSPVGGSAYRLAGWTWQIRTLNIFTLGKTTGAEVSFYHRSLNRNGVWMERPVAVLDVGFRQKFAQGKGTLSVTVSDLLWRSYIQGSASYPGMNLELTGRNDSRRVRIALSWKFGKSKYQRDERRKSGEDEINRAQ